MRGNLWPPPSSDKLVLENKKSNERWHWRRAFTVALCMGMLLYVLPPLLFAPSVASTWKQCNIGQQSPVIEFGNTFWLTRACVTAAFVVACTCCLFTFLTTELFGRVPVKLYHFSASMLFTTALLMTAWMACPNESNNFLGLDPNMQFSVAYASAMAGLQALTTFVVLVMVFAKVQEALKGHARARMIVPILATILVLEFAVVVVHEYAFTSHAASGFETFPSKASEVLYKNVPITLCVLDFIFTVFSNVVLWLECLKVKRMVTEAPDREDLKAHSEDLWLHFRSTLLSTSSTSLFYMIWWWSARNVANSEPISTVQIVAHLAAMALDSITNDIAVQFMLRPGTLTEMKKSIQEAIKKAREDKDLSSWVDGHTFYFIDADKLRESTGPLPKFQELLKRPGWLIAQELSLNHILSGRTKDTVVVSYTWLTKHHPDPNGELVACLRDFLGRNPHIKKVWMDWPCLPQHERTPEEDSSFKAGLKSVNLVYLGLRVVVLFTPAYKDRFWPLLEFFLSFQGIGPQGLTPAETMPTSCIPAQSLKDKPEECSAEWEKLKADISTLSVDQLGKYLADPSINVTSGKDRSSQLGKILQLKDNIASLWPKLSAELAAEPLEPAATQATRDGTESPTLLKSRGGTESPTLLNSPTVNEKVIVWF